MYCPKCAGNNITTQGTSPNGGELMAAEFFGRDSEVYSSGLIAACKCLDCGCDFYVEV